MEYLKNILKNKKNEIKNLDNKYNFKKEIFNSNNFVDADTYDRIFDKNINHNINYERIKNNKYKQTGKNYNTDNVSLINNIKKNKVNVIAEIKKASPSKGILNAGLNVGEAASSYNKYKDFICGISVVTESIYFKGNPQFIKEVRRFSDLPILRKDFIFHESQIYESYELGANCILLISSILSLKKLKALYKKANEIGLEVLVEVHNKNEFDKAVDCGAKLIGINNRNLKNMQINLNNTIEIFKYAARENIKDKIIVCESGISDIEFIKEMICEGINVFLIGSYFMHSSNLDKTLKDFQASLRKSNLII